MPTEFAYPDQLGLSDQFLQFTFLIVAISVHFVPLVREVFRRGPMQNRDLVWGIGCLVIAWCLPPVVAFGVPARLESEFEVSASIATQIWSTPTWRWANGLAGMSVLIHICWLLSFGMKTHKPARVAAVYLLPYVPFCFPSLGHPRYIGYLSECRNHLNSVMLALHNDADTRVVLVPEVLDADTQPRSWRVELLPYLDQAPLRNSYDVTQPWDAPLNDEIAKKLVERLHCPGNYRPRDSHQRYYTAFAGVMGPNTFFAEDGKPRAFKDFTDGTSNTLAIVEACGANIVWTEPRDLRLSDIEIGVNRPGPTRGTSRGLISSCHPHRRGGHVAFADGSVHFVGEDADPKFLAAMLTINGGELTQYDEHKQIRWK